MNVRSHNGKVAAGFDAWMQVEERFTSRKIEFGKWWRLDASYWRVSWIEATNELYAVEEGESDRFILLTELDKKGVNTLMNKWFDGNNLHALLQRFGLAPP